MRRLFLLVCVAACVILVFTGCAASGKTAAKDVRITACKADPEGGHPTAEGRIQNQSSKASAYTVHVKFKDSSGNAVGDGLTAVAKVGAGKTAQWDAVGTFNAKGPLTCSLERVTRNVSP